jgi:hypothetical protein
MISQVERLLKAAMCETAMEHPITLLGLLLAGD